MKAKRNKFIALFMVLAFMVMNCATYERGKGLNLTPGQKPGANLLIQKKDGQNIYGELIAVKDNSLLLLEGKGFDTRVDINEIKLIRIKRKSRIGSASAGAVVGIALASALGLCIDITGWDMSEREEKETRVKLILGGSLILGSTGALIGILATGKYENIQIEGKSDSHIKGILENLRKKARIPNYN